MKGKIISTHCLPRSRTDWQSYCATKFQKKQTLQTCQRCGGTGIEPDHKETGRLMRKTRQEKNVTQTEMARRLGFTKSYLSDLELGRRGWRTELQNRFLRECK